MNARSAKRQIGGHFGSALGASTKRQRGAGWRDEIDGPEGTTSQVDTLTGDGGSESDALFDPGTPLSSEPEDNGVSGVAVVEERPEPLGIIISEVPLIDNVQCPIVITFELIIGESICGSMRVLLKKGLDKTIEERLAACAPPHGANVEAIITGAVCAFGGYGQPTIVRKEQIRHEAGENEGEQDCSKDMAGNQLIGDAVVVSKNSSCTGQPSLPEHSCAGLLSAPRSGPGLLFTLGPQPNLDAAHQVLGPVLFGRRTFQRLEALAPLSGNAEPRQPLAVRTVGPGQNTNQHPFLLLEPATDCIDSVPFAWEDAGDTSAAEKLDIVELEINGRDVEITDLKQAAFNRERQQGVAAIGEALRALEKHLDGLSNMDDSLIERRSWLQERTNHLMRILLKLK